MNVVVDASVAISWFFRESESRQALANDLLDQNNERQAPDVIVAEVLSALHRKVRLKEITPEQGKIAVRALDRYFEHLTPSADLAARAWDLAFESGHPFQDCLYLALALDSGGRLATFDERLAKLARSYGVSRFRKKSRDRSG